VILTEDPRLQRLLRHVKDNLSRPISLAEAAHLSPGAFRQRFEYLGAGAAGSAS